MSLEMKIRIFLTKYSELVNETGISIRSNLNADRDGTELMLRFSEENKESFEDCPTYLPFLTEGFAAVMSDENGNLSMIEPYHDMPQFVTDVELSDDDIREQLEADGIYL